MDDETRRYNASFLLYLLRRRLMGLCHHEVTQCKNWKVTLQWGKYSIFSMIFERGGRKRALPSVGWLTNSCYRWDCTSSKPRARNSVVCNNLSHYFLPSHVRINRKLESAVKLEFNHRCSNMGLGSPIRCIYHLCKCSPPKHLLNTLQEIVLHAAHEPNSTCIWWIPIFTVLVSKYMVSYKVSKTCLLQSSFPHW